MTSGRTMQLVASSLPPIPVSRITKSGQSASSRAIAINIKNRNSKYDGCPRPSASNDPILSLTASNAFRKTASETGLPLKTNRSFTETRCGDVKSPVLYPASLKTESRNAQTEPFPFVPAT